MGKPSSAPTARTKSTVSFMAAHGPYAGTARMSTPGGAVS